MLVLSNSLGLVNFLVWLVDSVPSLARWENQVSWEKLNYRSTVRDELLGG